MQLSTRHSAACLALLGSLACGGDVVSPPPPPPPGPVAELNCAGVTALSLSVGQSSVVAIDGGSQCVRLTAQSGSAEYLVVATSVAAAPTQTGVLGDFLIRGRSAVATTMASPTSVMPTAAEEPAAAFHGRLREIERQAAARPRLARRTFAARTTGIDDLVSNRSFNVCASVACAEFSAVPAHLAFGNGAVAIYSEDNLPAGGYDESEVARTGLLFSESIYPLDTTAFGRESDVDGNGRVIVLLTKAVNRLTPVCLGGIIVGYFLGTDLLPAEPGSNGAEILYIGVPDPNGEAGCRVTKDFTTRLFAPTVMHELQHVISFNQHALLRSGKVEQGWLNEALSHFAEELGGRSIANDQCYLHDCLSQFAVPTLTNAYRYLMAPDQSFLVYPIGSTGTMSERGAAWLFLRWLADHYGNSGFTRRLVETAQTGVANIGQLVNVPFANLVAEWQLSNWVDDLPGFHSDNPRLGYSSWNLRATFGSFYAQARSLYPRQFPLVPDSLTTNFDLGGVLRGGSGRYLRIIVDAAASPTDLRLSAPDRGPLSVDLSAALAVVRIR